MTEPHVITALVAKRAELSGELAKLDERRAALKAHMANLDAVLRLFCYAGDPSKIKPRRKRNWIFRRGEALGWARRWPAERPALGKTICRFRQDHVARYTLAGPDRSQ